MSFFDEHDELYWEVGRGLDANVERLSAEVSFERPRSWALRMRLMRSPMGSFRFI